MQTVDLENSIIALKEVSTLLSVISAADIDSVEDYRDLLNITNSTFADKYERLQKAFYE